MHSSNMTFDYTLLDIDLLEAFLILTNNMSAEHSSVHLQKSQYEASLP